MKVINYLQAKYRQRYPTTCKVFEAKIFGIPYPLESGWLTRYGGAEINLSMLSSLERGLRRALLSTSSNTAWAKEGLKAIDRAHIIDRSLAITSEGTPYQSADWHTAVRALLTLSRHTCALCSAADKEFRVKHLVDIPALFLDFDNLLVLCAPCADMWDEQPRNVQGHVSHRLSKKLALMVESRGDIKRQDLGPRQPADSGKVVAANAGCGWLKQRNEFDTATT
jgi:hypothetical protein